MNLIDILSPQSIPRLPNSNKPARCWQVPLSASSATASNLSLRESAATAFGVSGSKGWAICPRFGYITRHGLSQLRVHFIGYRHHVHQQNTEVHPKKVLLQGLEDRDL